MHSRQAISRNSNARRNAVTSVRGRRRVEPFSKRMRGKGVQQGPFIPPENWYEPSGASAADFTVIEQSPGLGFRHVVTAREVRERLSLLPREFIAPLEVLQLSRMTRKKKTFPCYGMQWGSALYLYPIEESLVEEYGAPPKPAQITEARMYGGVWEQDSSNGWCLRWTEATIKDYYLNNILIHELGHLLDDRNTSYVDRERYAEWFAIEHGYRRSRQEMAQRAGQKIFRRHSRK